MKELMDRQSFGIEFQFVEVRQLKNPSQLEVQKVLSGWVSSFSPSLILIVGGCSVSDDGVVPLAAKPLITKNGQRISDGILTYLSVTVASEIIATQCCAAGSIEGVTFLATIPAFSANANAQPCILAALDFLLPLLPRIFEVMKVASVNPNA
jgi:molybdopterin biosynthesis enzyme MoaB